MRHSILLRFQFIKLYVLFCGFVRALLVSVMLAACDVRSQEPWLVRAPAAHPAPVLALFVRVVSLGRVLFAAVPELFDRLHTALSRQ